MNNIKIIYYTLRRKKNTTLRKAQTSRVNVVSFTPSFSAVAMYSQYNSGTTQVPTYNLPNYYSARNEYKIRIDRFFNVFII